MGQIKNIKLHIVTDIKPENNIKIKDIKNEDPSTGISSPCNAYDWCSRLQLSGSFTLVLRCNQHYAQCFQRICSRNGMLQYPVRKWGHSRSWHGSEKHESQTCYPFH